LLANQLYSRSDPQYFQSNATPSSINIIDAIEIAIILAISTTNEDPTTNAPITIAKVEEPRIRYELHAADSMLMHNEDIYSYGMLDIRGLASWNAEDIVDLYALLYFYLP